MVYSGAYNFEPPGSSGGAGVATQYVLFLQVYGKDSARVYPKLYPRI